MSEVLKSSRRNFLKNVGVVGLGFWGLKHLADSSLFAKGQPVPAPNNGGYGPLVPDPVGILNLPKGFSYKVISRQGRPMSDGFLVPGQPDGMAAFGLDKERVIIVRNHELEAFDQSKSPYGIGNQFFPKMNRSKIYDAGMGMAPQIGGTTTLVYNLRTLQVEKEFLSLTGTCRNCAGGPTPWGSWLTCEESVIRKDMIIEKDHGFIFEVPATAEIGLADPIPLKEMGRFNHEAIAVDPKSGVVYETEDRPDGLFYRFIPNEPGQLAKGGKLQALALKGQRRSDTRNWGEFLKPDFPIGKPLEVEWIDLKHTFSPYDEMRYEGFRDGAARFARGEGIWFGNEELYFACTNGGKNRLGQVFRYTPSEFEGTTKEKDAPGKLELFIEPNDMNTLKSCDNLTISNWGDVIMCEDDPHPFVVGVTQSGELYKLVENAGFPSEFTGVCFSPDGSTMFLNIQYAGYTFAITGPWQS